MNETASQRAPYPEILAGLVNRLAYKEGWQFDLSHRDRGQGSMGLTLAITITSPDSYRVGQTISVLHHMIVPPAAYNEKSWRRWLFEQILLVEQHEAMEFFMIDGHRPYAPSHGPGNDPYTITEQGTVEAANTRFTGERSRQEA